MERFNAAMQDIQNDGSMAQWLEVRGKEVKAREWAKLVDVVHDQAYGRVVGPYSNELEVSQIYSMGKNHADRVAPPETS